MATEITAVPKINGFTRGINLHQITSYFLLLTKIFFFFFLMISKFPTYLQIIVSVLYLIPTLGTIVTGVIVTGIDPTDDIVIEEKRCQLEGKPFESDRYEYQCEYCNTSVSNHSKHCRTCNRCVQKFDHHCKWVNNCIAGKNYKVFIIMILNLALSAFCFVIVGLLFILDYFTEKIGIIENVSSFKADHANRWQIAVIIAYVLVITVFAVLDVKLLYFHLYLIRNKMTTYDYIMKLRANKEKGLSKNMKGKRTISKIMPIQTPESPDNEYDDGRTFNIDQPSSNKILNINTISKIDFRKINSDIEKGHSPESFAIEMGLQNQTSDDYYSKQHTIVQSPSHQLLSKQNCVSEPGTPTRLQNKEMRVESPTSNLVNHTKLEEIIQSHKALRISNKDKLKKQRSDSGVTATNLTTVSVNQDHLSPKSVSLVNLSSKDDGINEKVSNST